MTITVHAEPTASGSKTSESKSDSKSEAKSDSKKDSTCASDSASTVVSKALRDLKNKKNWDQWTNVSESYEGYDPCAELSWIDAVPGSSPSSCCTAAMVHHILLFHRGKFIGTATYEPYSFSPVITRTSDSSIRVTYRYMKDDEKVHNEVCGACQDSDAQNLLHGITPLIVPVGTRCFTPSGSSPESEGQAGRHPHVVPLFPILPAFEQCISVWRAESAF